ncbi:MAG: site-specific integrase [Patescibacteria group bacterium]
MRKELTNLLADFIRAKKQEISPATLNNYKFYLGRFIDLMDISETEELNYPAIRAFRLRLNRLKLNQSTQNYHLIALRAFLKFLNKENINNLDPEKISLYPVKNKTNEIVSRKDLEKIMAAPEEQKIAAIIRKRDRLLLELLFSSQLKVSEICRLKRKGLYDLGLGQQGNYWLKEYLNERKDKCEFIFIRHDRASGKSSLKPLTPRSIQRIVAGYAKKIGFAQKITPESFRKPPLD